MFSGCQQISVFSEKDLKEETDLKVEKEPTQEESEIEENITERKDIVIGESLQSTEAPETIKNPPTVLEETAGECILNENPHILCVLPEDSLQPNPRNLDTKLFAIFQNLKNQAFDRKEGIMEVYTEDTKGIIKQILQFEVSAAFDEEGKADPQAEIEADMEITSTISNNTGYWENNSLEFGLYCQYQEQMLCLQTPFLGKGFNLASLSELSAKAKGDNFLITATFDQSAAESILERKPEGIIKASAEITKDGKLVVLTLNELTVDPDNTENILSHTQYSFKSIYDNVSD